MQPSGVPGVTGDIPKFLTKPWAAMSEDERKAHHARMADVYGQMAPAVRKSARPVPSLADVTVPMPIREILIGKTCDE